MFSIRAFSQRYNHHIIMEAFAQAKPHFDKNAVLVFKTYNQKYFAGAIEYEEIMRRRAKELRISDSIRWMEEVPLHNCQKYTP